MRPLTEQESKQLFDKLAKYIGGNTKHLLEPRSNGVEWVFRLHDHRIWYMPSPLAKLSSCIAKKNLMGIGVLIAKITHHDHIRIQVTALDVIAPLALFKVWVKPNQEQSYLYGNHISRAGLGRITEDTPQYQGVAVFNMGDIAIGFGVAAQGTMQCRRCEMNTTVLFHEADVGEYLRDEQTLT